MSEFTLKETESIEGVTRVKTVNLGSSVAIRGVENTEATSVEIPEAVDEKPITRVLEEAFANCDKISSFDLPYSITQIDDRAFSGCDSLIGITLPFTAETLGVELFRDCVRLERVIMPSSMKVLPEGTFAGCENLKSVTLPDSLESIGDGALDGCVSLKEFVIPKGIKVIPEGMFSECRSLETVTIPADVREIGAKAFAGCERLEAIVYQGTEAMWNAIKKKSNFHVGCPETLILCNDKTLKLKKQADMGAEAGKAAKAIGKGALSVATGAADILSDARRAMFGTTERTKNTFAVISRIIAILAMIGTVLNSIFIHTAGSGYDATFFIVAGALALVGVGMAILEKLVFGSTAIGVLNIISAGLNGLGALLKLFHSIDFIGIWGLTVCGFILYVIICMAICYGRSEKFKESPSEATSAMLVISTVFFAVAVIANIVFGIVFGDDYNLTFFIVSGALFVLNLGSAIFFNVHNSIYGTIHKVSNGWYSNSYTYPSVHGLFEIITGYVAAGVDALVCWLLWMNNNTWTDLGYMALGLIFVLFILGLIGGVLGAIFGWWD